MIAWLALATAVVALVPWIVLGVTVPRFWRKVEPQVRPLLTMFAPPPAPAPHREGCDCLICDPGGGL